MTSEATQPGPDAAYLAALQAGEFQLQSCGGCGEFTYPPKLLCPLCGSRDMAFQPLSGRGTLHAFTVIPRSAEKGGPYNVALVDLAEGPRMMSRVEGCAPDDLAIGMALTVRIDLGPSGPLPVFLPQEAKP